jgi:hypothetical protein
MMRRKMTADMVFENFNLGQALVKSLEQAVEFEHGDKTKARTVVCAIPKKQTDTEFRACAPA